MTNAPAHPLHLELSKITKVYPGVIALNEVDLAISGGEIVGVIGENGAGKSTLMKVLGGIISPNFGKIRIDSQELPSLTPAAATELGIAFVHQELHPFTNLDVTANILLGREVVTGVFRRLDQPKMVAEVEPILKLLGARFGPTDSVADLSLADQQLLEIAKALSMNARLIIMDEPTSSLTLVETERLLEVMQQLRESGVAILFISHRLSEIEEIADRVLCLRDGQNTGELAGPDIQKDTMIRMMVGRDVKTLYEKSRHQKRETVLELRDVRTTAFPNASVDLKLNAGEITGLAGLVGAGRTELARAMFGIDPLAGGTITIHDKILPSNSVVAAMANGLCLVPENRKEEGLLLDFSIADNICLPNLTSLSNKGVLNAKNETALAVASKDSLKIKAASLSGPAGDLSGGNQQKIVLAKWLALKPRVIILDEPTRGVDVGAKSEVYHLMQQLAKEGVAILMISSDMEEVIGVADRVAVMRQGIITGILGPDELTEENILRLGVE